MTTVTTTTRSAPFTRADLDALPDDGRRHELVDGSLLVTPAPNDPHQSAVVHLVVALSAACPDDLRVRTGPYDVALPGGTGETVLQPDVLVARADEIAYDGLHTSPVLAVEVLSPSTRLVDLSLKRARYEAAGCPSYWVVDPADTSLTAWDLAEDGYGEVAHVIGDETFRARSPFTVEITPSALFD